MPLKNYLKGILSKGQTSVINYEFQTDLPAFLLTDQLGTLYAVSSGRGCGAPGSGHYLGEAERVSENLSDAQCYKKKRERDGEKERREIGAGREGK